MSVISRVGTLTVQARSRRRGAECHTCSGGEPLVEYQGRLICGDCKWSRDYEASVANCGHTTHYAKRATER